MPERVRLRDDTAPQTDPYRMAAAGAVLGAVANTGTSTSINDASHETLRSIGASAAIFVPIHVRERVLGVMALVRARPGAHYDASDVALFEELGGRAGAALENAELYLAA